MKKNLLCLIPLLATLGAQAQTTPEVYIWDNQQGLVRAAGCEVSDMKTTPFLLSTAADLKNDELQTLSSLVDGSLIKLSEAAKKDGHHSIEVVGINKNNHLAGWPSSRLDKGYIDQNFARSLKGHVIEVDHSNISKDQKSILSNTNSSFWISEGEDSYKKLNCLSQNKGRDYTLFRVYDQLSNDVNTKAFVGVFKDESKIFENIKITSLTNLNVDIADRKTDYAIKHLISDREQDEDFSDFLNDIEDESNQAGPAPHQASKVKSVDGSFTDVICTSSSINIRDKSLDKVLFTANAGEVIKRFQSFNDSEKKEKIGNKTYTFIKVQFADREESDQNVGWVADNFIAKESQCRFLNRSGNNDLSGFDVQISGLDDSNCCEFPTIKKPTESYTSGMQMFNARRGGGTRTHAASDLYRYKDEAAVAVAPGKVIRQLYYFYEGTYAMEVVHSGGFVVRYGEITGKKAPGTTNGKKIKMGQKVGEIAKITTKSGNCCTPMLHFELYSGKAKGPLKGGGKYQRRSDLMNPTDYLLEWERNKF